MAKPVIYYDNALRRAQEGTDGTKYATGADCEAHPGSAFGLLSNLTLATDLGGVYTGLPGLSVVMDSTENPYLITAQADIVNVLPSTNGWWDVCWSGSLYCAVGDGNGGGTTDKCATSPDGITWYEHTLPASRAWRAVAWNGIYFVALAYGSDKGAYSADGVNWTEMTMPASRNWVSLAWNGTVFSAVAFDTDKSATSADGITWDEQTMFGSRWFFDICWDGLKFCAVAEAFVSTNICETSSDGITWAAKNLPAARNWTSVISNGSVMVALAYGSDKGAKSTDNGDTWSEITLSSSQNWMSVSWNGTRFLAVAIGTDKGSYSLDGTTWVECTLPTSADRHCVTSDGEFFITLTHDTDDCHISRDAVYWPTRSLTLHERFQISDIGGAFSIQAGLTCAQQDTSRVAPYAADNSLSPMFKGTVNTALYLRAHLPNFLKDGGFESGAFSPNWVAEATNPWVIESTTELEGSYSASWDLVASKYLRQSGTERLEKGVTYRLIFKAKSVTQNPTSGAIVVNLYQTTSGTAVDADAAGTSPAITTSSTWFAIDFTPDFETNDWYINIAGDSTKANGATEITVDEFYFYKKPTVDTLIIGRHNLVGKASLVVRSYKCSPLRSTIGADDYTEIKSAFTVDTSDTYTAALTTSYDPIYQIEIPATASFTPQLGDLYIGSSWTMPRYPQAPLDPYRVNAAGQREVTLQFRSLAPAYRTTNIKDLLAQLKASEAIWVKIGSDQPLMMTSPQSERAAPYNPYAVDLDLALVEVP